MLQVCNFRVWKKSLENTNMRFNFENFIAASLTVKILPKLDKRFALHNFLSFSDFPLNTDDVSSFFFSAC
jgi:hypothetical protein